MLIYPVYIGNRRLRIWTGVYEYLKAHMLRLMSIKRMEVGSRFS